MKVLLGAALTAFTGAVFFMFLPSQTVVLQGLQDGSAAVDSSNPLETATILPNISEASGKNGDIPKQRKLPNPPEIAKAIYITGWSAGSKTKMDSLMNLIETRGLNAVVIDIKDYSGYVSYAMDIPEVKASGAGGEIRILRPNELIKRLHDKGVYVIGRVTVFQDPILAKAHPEWALRDKTTGKTWLDNHKLAWMDPAGKAVWDYNIAIAKDALNRGFDEINFDYVRFASDGNLSAMSFPFWQKTPTSADYTRTDAESKIKTSVNGSAQAKTETKREVIRNFFAYLREQLRDAVISADLFGLATINTSDDLGIGQVIEDAYQYFDYVCPMVYPSHYAAGTLGYKNPAAHPYEIIKYSMDKALERLMAYGKGQIANGSSATSSSMPLAISDKPLAKLRSWIQVFDLGTAYTPAMVADQIRATEDTFASSTDPSTSLPSTQLGTGGAGKYYGGWMLWDPANNYRNFRN